jgi:hypothetical protein
MLEMIGNLANSLGLITAVIQIALWCSAYIKKPYALHFVVPLVTILGALEFLAPNLAILM